MKKPIILRIEETYAVIRKINQLIKQNSKVEYRKIALERVREKLENNIKKLIIEFINSPNCFLIDLASISVISLKAKTSRYLRNKLGYYNKYNMLCALSTEYFIVMFTENSQITRKDLQKLTTSIKRLIPDSEFATDKRHKGIANFPKFISYNGQRIQVTQKIENIFNMIKKPIYKQLKPKQKWINHKLITDITIEELLNLYIEQIKKTCKKLNLKLIFLN